MAGLYDGLAKLGNFEAGIDVIVVAYVGGKFASLIGILAGICKSLPN
jgi:hypothetical protein